MQYRLTQRKGRCVQVSYDEGKTWTSTGCRTLSEAHKKLTKEKETTFGEYADGFYDRTDKQSYLYNARIRNIRLAPSTMYNKRMILKKYILPEFRDYNIKDILARDIRRWIIPLKSFRGTDIGIGMKNLIMWVFCDILDYAVEDGLVETNEARKFKRFRKERKRRNSTAVLSKDELDILFPKDNAGLVKVWGGIEYAKFFMIMRDTGFRPSIILGLRHEDIHGNSVYTDHMYDDMTKKVEDRIKTSRSGKDYNVGTLTPQTMMLIGIGRGNLFNQNEIYRHKTYHRFKTVCYRYLGRTDVTQYSLRHAFMTNLISKYPKELIMELMGHTTWESCYDDRTPEMIMENLRKALSRYQA